MHNFKELKIWQLSMNLAQKVYSITRDYPDIEKFGLISQTRRAAVSVSSNIAEGCGRVSNNQLIHYLNLANGSLFEIETQIILAKRLKYIDKDRSGEILNEIEIIQKMIFKFKERLNSI